MHEQVSAAKVFICVIASQIASFDESIIGAALQEKEGFRWVSFNFHFTIPFMSSRCFCFQLRGVVAICVSVGVILPPLVNF